MVALVSVIRTLDLTPSRDWPRSPQPTSRPWTSLTRLESSPLRRSALCRLIFDVSERRLLRWRKNVWSADASSNGATTFHYASFARASFAQMTWNFFFLGYSPFTAPFSIHYFNFAQFCFTTNQRSNLISGVGTSSWASSHYQLTKAPTLDVRT